MPTTGEHLQTEYRDMTAFGRVLVELRQHGPKPDLKFLTESLLGALADQTGVQVVTIAVNPAVTDLLDTNWRHRSVRVLMGGPVLNSTQWQSHPVGWPSQLPIENFDKGTQPLPVGTPWPFAKMTTKSPGANGDWARLLVRAGERPALLISLGFDDSLTHHPHWERELVEMQLVLQLILDQWMGFVSRDLELQQLSSQKNALSRLNRLQGRFVGMASHEFKTPLTSITAYADALLGQFDEEKMPLATEFLGVIRNEAGRLLRMINRILDFSRMEYGARLLGATSHDLRPLILETILALRPTVAAKNLTCVLDDTQLVPRALVDADLIRQVMVNLIGNAVKFTPEAGHIAVSLHETESSVEVRIADTGPGIPQRDIHRIFREFYRSRETASREEGTGLGLTIVRHIINLHAGSVEAHQRLGGGSVFTFRVPKEVYNLGPLPSGFTSIVEEEDARRLLTGTLQLVAEMAGVKKLVMLLRDDSGELNPVAGFGWLDTTSVSWTAEQLDSWKTIQGVRPIDDNLALDWSWYPDGQPDAKTAMVVSLPWGKQNIGCLVLQDPTFAPEFGAHGQEQLMVLSHVVATAINELVRDDEQIRELSGTAQVTKTIEALRTLLQIRRNGVPTAEPEALHLIGALAREMKLPEQQILDLQYASALHDAGMARVEDEILLGETELSFDERDEVDRHVEQGVDLMGPLLPNDSVAEMISHHHERFDGSGFPRGKQGSEIPIGARLLAVIDTWFSLTRGRSYRAGLPAKEALQEIHENSGTQFDPSVVAAFEKVLKQEGCLLNSHQSQGPKNHGPFGFGI